MLTGEEPMTTDGAVLRIDGSRPWAESAAELAEFCGRVEDLAGAAVVVVRVSGVPDPGWSAGLVTAQISRWERALRRLERVPAATIAVADADCGGTALDALLVADHRIAASGIRLVPSVEDGSVWPGMALYRLAQQTGNARAVRRAVLFGEPLTAPESLAGQVVDEVADDVDAALAAALERARPFSGPDLAIRRQLLADAGTVAFEDALGVHLAACDRLLRRAAAGSVR